mgnify:CR=1 FL=1
MVLINKKFKRFSFLIIICCSISLAAFFVLKALEEKIVFFYTPTNLYENVNEKADYVRVGGLVKEKSIFYSNDGLEVNFMITDNKNFLKIIFEGILPDLFREKQGVVVEGNFDKVNNLFIAKKVLAKHDENYMPPEIEKALESRD